MKFRGTIFVGPQISDRSLLAKLPDGYAGFLEDTNGLIAFDGGLHIRGVCDNPEWHSLAAVSGGDHALHRMFNSIQPTDIPFAQDCLGDQFILRASKVLRVSAETDNIECLDADFEHFIETAEAQPIQFLHLEPLVQFMRDGGRLQPGELLSVYPPFCTEEAAQGVHLEAAPIFQRLEVLSQISRQLSKLADGTKFKVEFDGQE